MEAADGPSSGAEIELGSTTPSASVFSAVAADISPQINALEVNPSTQLIIPFNSVLHASSIAGDAVPVTVDEETVDVSVALVNSGQAIEVKPSSGSWALGTTHVVSLSNAIQTQAGASLNGSFDFSFTTLNSSSLVAWWDFDNSLLNNSGNNNTIDTNLGVVFNIPDRKHQVRNALSIL